MFRYASIGVHYRDGKLSNGYLTVIEHFDNSEEDVHLAVTLTNPKEIMTTLRKLEKVAGHSAELDEDTVYGLFGKPMKTFRKWISVMR